MEKKEFKSSFSYYKDTSDCDLETEHRDFEAYVDNDHIRVINRNAHSVTTTHLNGKQATGLKWDDKLLHDLRSIVKCYLSCFFDKCSLYGYTYSKDHKLILVSKGSERWIVNRDDLSNMCDYATTGKNMTPMIMRSIISLMDRDWVSVHMFDLMVEYAMG